MNELNVYQRLLNVRKSVSYLKKDAKNVKQGFDYVSSSQTLGNLKEEMDNQGLMLIPSVEGFEVRDHQTSGGGHWYFTILDMTFTWVNVDKPDDRVVSKWTGHGLDSGEKSVGKACTYAEKYFLLKFFNIATDKDDPDAFEKKHDTNGKSTTKKTTPKSDKDKDDKIKVIRECLGDMGRWGFEEQQDGSVLRYKIESQETVNTNALSALKTISSFPGKDGKDDFKGFDSLKSLETIKETWLNSVYGNVQTEHKAWKEKFDNSTETKQQEAGDGDLPF